MIGDEIAAVLPELRAHAESLMVDTCTIVRHDPNAEWVTGPDGYDVPPAPTQVYSGPCKVQTYEAYESTRDVGGATTVLQRYTLHVPVSAGPFRVGDEVAVSARVFPARYFRVAGTHEKSLQTAQRLLVDEGAPGPEFPVMDESSPASPESSPED